MNKTNRGFVVLCALVLVMLSVTFAFPTEGEAAGTVRKALPRAGAGAARQNTRVFASGAGTQRSPHVIRTAAQLSAFAASVNGGNTYAGKYVRLGADIDLKDMAWTSAGRYSKDGNSRPFKGFFDGAGFTIYNIGSGKRAGALFGALEGAVVERVSLQFAEVTGDTIVGALVGFMADSTLKNCLVSGTVRGQSAVGGIAGSVLKGTVENCDFSGSVVGEDGVGGLAGAVDRATIRLSDVTGSVEGTSDVGGFIGGVLDGMIMDCSASSVTVNGGRNVGGFIGSMIDGGRVNKVTFNGQAVGNTNVGGLVGRMSAGRVMSSSVSGSVKGRTQSGGVVGEMTSGEVLHCESAAAVDGMSSLGGITGLMSGGRLDNNVNRGAVNGGEAIGGIVGNFTGGDLNFASNRNTGFANGYIKAGPVVGAQEGIAD